MDQWVRHPFRSALPAEPAVLESADLGTAIGHVAVDPTPPGGVLAPVVSRAPSVVPVCSDAARHRRCCGDQWERVQRGPRRERVHARFRRGAWSLAAAVAVSGENRSRIDIEDRGVGRMIESPDWTGSWWAELRLVRGPAPLWVHPDDAAVLNGWLRDATVPALARRARIVLLCRDGHGPSAVALRLGCAKQTVISWRERYRRQGLDGLRDAPRSGRPSTVDPAAVVLAMLQPPDEVGARWSTRSLGAALGISNVAVANVWREWGIRPQVGGRVSLRTEPALEAVVSGVVGLHVDPPVFLFAAAVDDRPDTAVESGVSGRAAGPRPALGGLLADLVLSAQSEAGDRVATGAFLDRLDESRDHWATRATAVVAAGDTASVGAALAARGGVSVHAAASVARWERMVRVACLLAGSDPDGAASVEALRIGVRDHVAGPFSWTRT